VDTCHTLSMAHLSNFRTAPRLSVIKHDMVTAKSVLLAREGRRRIGIEFLVALNLLQDGCLLNITLYTDKIVGKLNRLTNSERQIEDPSPPRASLRAVINDIGSSQPVPSFEFDHSATQCSNLCPVLCTLMF
jgi:hypothetical protein